jgi:hypothetical protein
LELFIALRNKVEHRYEHTLRAAAGGRAHAFVINFEQELVANFGSEHSLADQLRFPLFVESITAPERKDTIKATRALRAAQTVLAKFDAGLDSEVLDDQRYDFRIRLVPMLGLKSAADAAVEFVNLDELTDDERKVMIEAGRSGRVITKVKKVPVSSAGCMLPKQVVSEVQKRVPVSTPGCGSTSSFIHLGGWHPTAARPCPSSASPTSRPGNTSIPRRGLTRSSRRSAHPRSSRRPSALRRARAW